MKTNSSSIVLTLAVARRLLEFDHDGLVSPFSARLFGEREVLGSTRTPRAVEAVRPLFVSDRRLRFHRPGNPALVLEDEER
jgi:hypothetical protein